ncbi:MAG: phage major tail tube protein [Oligoflexus sp.]
MQLPRKLVKFDMFLNGNSYAGLITELTLPVLTLQTIEYQSGGMDMPVELEMGMEKLEASFVLGEYSPEVFGVFGFQNNGRQNIIARGSMKLFNQNAPIVASMRGIVKQIDMGSWQAGEDSSMTFMMNPYYYKLEIAGQKVIEVDAETGKRLIGGSDQLEAVRRAILL